MLRLTLFVALVALNPLFAETFKVADPAARDTVRFTLDAPFEVINGTTNQIKGSLTVKNKRVSGSFEVPVSSIKTGIDSRDEHIQNDKWLNAKKYPNIKFTLNSFKVSNFLFKGKPFTKRVTGQFSIHGKTRKEAVELTLHYLPESDLTKKRLPGNLMRIKAKVKIRLADYGVAQSDSKVKSLLGLKVGKEADIVVDLMGTDK